MKLLLDTQTLLLAATEDSRLGKDALELITDEDNEVYFSSASIWELVHWKDKSPISPSKFRMLLLENDYQELPITATHTLGVQLLPSIHKNPFDRIIIAQSCAESIFLLTQSQYSSQYPGVLSVQDLIALKNR